MSTLNRLSKFHCLRALRAPRPTSSSSSLSSISASSTIKVPSVGHSFSTFSSSSPPSSNSVFSRSHSVITSAPAAPAAAAAASSLPNSRCPSDPPSPTPPGIAELVHERAASAVENRLHDDRFIGMNGGQIFVELMREHAVDTIFGYPGGAILPIFDGIHKSPYFNFILPRHEQGGGHMAEGYARATGRPGILLVTSGPGATNTITPMQDALSDGTPMIVFTGQVPTTAIGSDAFQEADVLGISRSCTKWNTMVKDIADLPSAVRTAFLVATTGRPGPVLVDLPKDVTSSTLTRAVSTLNTVPSFYKFQLNQSGRQQLLEEAARKSASMINQAQRPVLYVGQGATEHYELIRSVASRFNIPVTTTLQGMGIFDELSPLSLHMLGMHGSAYANLAMQNADVIIAVGARFDDRVTGAIKKFAPAAKKASLEGRGGIIHLEMMSKNINKVVPVDISMEGDCGASLSLIVPHLVRAEREQWFKQIDEWKQRYPFAYDRDAGPEAPLKPQAVLEELDRQLYDVKDKVIMTTGVGQHQMWAAQWIRWRYPRRFITSGGLGTMGYGVPSAIGAKVAKPDHIVIDIDGDASFSMTMNELATAAEYGVGIKVLLLNNNFQGMVKQWQDLFYSKRYSGTKMSNPDWVKLAESMHATGLRVTKQEDLSEVISEFIKTDGPVVLDALVDDSEHVYPMVPAGKALDEMVMSPELKKKQHNKK